MKLIDAIHKHYMIKLYTKYHNKTHAAKILGIHVRTWRKWEIRLGLRKMFDMSKKL